MGKQPDVPDLDLPTNIPLRAPSSQPAVKLSAAPSPSADEDDLFGGGIERGSGSLAPPTSAGTYGKSIGIDIAGGGDDLDDSLERGGGYEPPPQSGRAPVASSRAPASLNLDVAYKRPTRPVETYEPSFLEKAGGRVLALVGLAASLGPLLKYVHHAGAREVTKLLPHAFDATSLVQSGAVAGVMLVASIAIGYLGIKARPRSWAMILSGFIFLLGLLAMVTVALVATDENPAPPDGARLIPFVVPAGLVLLGLGVSSRGQEPFFDGGAKRALPFVWGLFGGLIVFAGIALSSY